MRVKKISLNSTFHAACRTFVHPMLGHMKHLSPRKIGIYLGRGFYFALFVFVSAAFFAALQFYLVSQEFATLAAICGPVLAILFGFSALLYNRARALPEGKEQRRSLYAAERGMQATVLFFFGTAIGGIGAALVHSLSSVGNMTLHPAINLVVSVLYFACIILVLYSFVAFFLALRTVAHKLLRWIPMRHLVRHLK